MSQGSIIENHKNVYIYLWNILGLSHIYNTPKDSVKKKNIILQNTFEVLLLPTSYRDTKSKVDQIIKNPWSSTHFKNSYVVKYGQQKYIKFH